MSLDRKIISTLDVENCNCIAHINGVFIVGTSSAFIKIYDSLLENELHEILSNSAGIITLVPFQGLIFSVYSNNSCAFWRFENNTLVKTGTDLNGATGAITGITRFSTNTVLASSNVSFINIKRVRISSGLRPFCCTFDQSLHFWTTVLDPKVSHFFSFSFITAPKILPFR